MTEVIVPMEDPRMFIPIMKASVITLVNPCSFGLILAITKEGMTLHLLPATIGLSLQFIIIQG